MRGRGRSSGMTRRRREVVRLEELDVRTATPPPRRPGRRRCQHPRATPAEQAPPVRFRRGSPAGRWRPEGERTGRSGPGGPVLPIMARRVRRADALTTGPTSDTIPRNAIVRGLHVMKQSFVVLVAAALSSLSVMTDAVANDFPTQARVEFVLGCMDQRGGQSYNSLIRASASSTVSPPMPYREYLRRRTLSSLRHSGEGGLFRDAGAAPKRASSVSGPAGRGEAACFVSGSASVQTQ